MRFSPSNNLPCFTRYKLRFLFPTDKARAEEREGKMPDGAVIIAAITSCTNTSNPRNVIAAGLLARNAVQRGLVRKPWVKTSLAPGSKAVELYLREAGLLGDLEQLGFGIVGINDRAIETGERFGKQRMVARQPIEPPRGTAQQGGAAGAAVECFHDRGKVARDPFALLHRGARLGEFGFFARLRCQRSQLGDAMFQPFAVALGCADVVGGGSWRDPFAAVGTVAVPMGAGAGLDRIRGV